MSDDSVQSTELKKCFFSCFFSRTYYGVYRVVPSFWWEFFVLFFGLSERRWFFFFLGIGGNDSALD